MTDHLPALLEVLESLDATAKAVRQTTEKLRALADVLRAEDRGQTTIDDALEPAPAPAPARSRRSLSDPRSHRQRDILARLAEHPATIPDTAQLLGLGIEGVRSTFKKLAADGLIETTGETRPPTGGRGRRSDVWRPTADGLRSLPDGGPSATPASGGRPAAEARPGAPSEGDAGQDPPAAPPTDRRPADPPTRRVTEPIVGRPPGSARIPLDGRVRRAAERADTLEAKILAVVAVRPSTIPELAEVIDGHDAAAIAMTSVRMLRRGGLVKHGFVGKAVIVGPDPTY